ncbi:MAG TPA: DUF2752 domain-containing protein [Pirellulales bacterium]|nr:DUF2752 domain-containing protein [Pirellulales bacterium]
MAGLILVGLLAVAAGLQPSPTGLGTHEQLGLPPCTFRWLFGMRCPSCGMTTSWSHAVRGELTAALAANVGGALLAFGSIVAAPWCVVSAAAGRWLVRPPRERVLAAAALFVAAVTLVDWIYRVTTG